MRSTALPFTLVLLVLAAGCNSLEGTGSTIPERGANAGADQGRIIALEARMIGLTEELDRFGRRLTALERSLLPGGGATVQKPAAPPEFPAETEPATPPEVLSETEEPAAREAEPKPESGPDPVEHGPVPESSGPYTSILIDARDIPAGSLPATSQPRWRIVDPEAVAIISSDDVDPEFLRTRPLFWTAKAGLILGPDSIPVLGGRPFCVEAVDGALVPRERTAEAVIYVDAETAAKLRALTGLPDLVRAGSLAILLRPDGE